MRIRPLCGCIAILAAVWGAKFFLPPPDKIPGPQVAPASIEFNAGSARQWLKDHQHTPVQLERTILRTR